MTFAEQLNALGVTISEEAEARYARYYRMLTAWNERFNLTAITEEREVYVKHFADSLAALPLMGGEVVDVGSGAGFPGLALAVADGASRYTLLDSVGKKVTFQEAVAKELGLGNVRSVHIRAEDAGRGEMREHFDVAVARAVASLPTLLEYLAPLVKTGGRVIVYKTRPEEELAAAAGAMTRLGVTLREVRRYDLEGMERCLIVLDKTRATPRQYPRGGNKPRTMPL